MSPDKNTGATAVVSVPASTISSSIDHQQQTQQQQQPSQLQHRSNVVTSISSSAVTSVVALATSTHTESNSNSNSSNNTANSQNLPPPGTGIPSSVLSTPVSILQLVPQTHPLSQSSVIQSNTTANQQSVIQATSGAAASAIQSASGKNVILLNTTAKHQNHPTGSVIQTVNTSDTSNDANIQLLNSRGELDAKLSAEEAESKKRREVLERRPSYRKILNDLSSTEVSAIAAQAAFAASESVIKNELPSPSNEHSHQHSQQQQQQQQHQQQQQSTTGNIVTPGASAPITVASSFVKVLPPGTIQLAPASQEHSLSSIPTALAVTNPNTASAGSSPGTIVQYAGQDAHGFFVPVSPYANGGHFNPAVTVSPADLQTYQIRSGNNSAHLPTGAMMSNSTGPGEEATKKRELRLQKNREAAKECRRKKKEYIKCLENRVAVLEKQNQALIDELKSLKELYCAKSD